LDIKSLVNHKRDITKYQGFIEAAIHKIEPKTMLWLLAALGIMLIGLTITNSPIGYTQLKVYGDDEDDSSNDEDDEDDSSNDEDDSSNDEDDSSNDEDDEDDEDDENGSNDEDCDVGDECDEGVSEPDSIPDSIPEPGAIPDSIPDSIPDTIPESTPEPDHTPSTTAEASSGSAPNYTPASDSHTKTFKNTPHGISTNYPSDWQIDGTDSNPKDGLIEIAHISPSSGTDERVEIGIDDQTAFGSTLEGYLKSTTDAYQNNFGGITVLESDTKSTVAGNPAYKIVFTSNDKTTQIMETGFIHGGKVYYITYIAKPDSYLTYLPDVQNIAESLIISR